MFGEVLTVRVDALGLALDDTLRLLERNAQALCAHGWGLLVLGHTVTKCCFGALRLDFILALLAFAVGDKDNVLAVNGGDEVIPIGELHSVAVVGSLSFFEHVFLDLLKQLWDGFLERIYFDLATCLVLVIDIATGGRDLTLLCIFRSCK